MRVCDASKGESNDGVRLVLALARGARSVPPSRSSLSLSSTTVVAISAADAVEAAAAGSDAPSAGARARDAVSSSSSQANDSSACSSSPACASAQRGCRAAAPEPASSSPAAAAAAAAPGASSSPSGRAPRRSACSSPCCCCFSSSSSSDLRKAGADPAESVDTRARGGSVVELIVAGCNMAITAVKSQIVNKRRCASGTLTKESRPQPCLPSSWRRCTPSSSWRRRRDLVENGASLKEHGRVNHDFFACVELFE